MTTSVTRRIGKRTLRNEAPRRVVAGDLDASGAICAFPRAFHLRQAPPKKNVIPLTHEREAW